MCATLSPFVCMRTCVMWLNAPPPPPRLALLTQRWSPTKRMVESSDEDVPVSGLGKSHAEAVPEAVPDAATPATKDSDDDDDSDDVVGGVRGRLAQKRAAAPVDDDLDDLVVSDEDAVPSGALKSRLKKKAAEAQAAAVRPPTKKKPKGSETQRPTKKNGLRGQTQGGR